MEDEKKLNEEKSESLQQKRTLRDFVGDIKGEFKKIIWLNRKDLTKQTSTVVVTSLIIGVLILGMDTVFAFAYSSIVSLIG